MTKSTFYKTEKQIRKLINIKKVDTKIVQYDNDKFKQYMVDKQIKDAMNMPS